MYAPYPLINTCLNLLTSKEEKKKKFQRAKADFIEDGKLNQKVDFAGAKTSDYFLLSPLFCGSKLAGYVPTDDTYNYRDLTLPAAATISAAAVNPGMGSYSNKILGILTTVFNLRLGYWILNPKKTKLYDSLVWYPRYFVYELLGMIGMKNELLNISDGGHIENLAIYELLRRRCKLIIAVDAEADPEFSFAALENLAIRARNELGLEIRFAKNYLEEKIRPKPSIGYSEKRFAVAEICHLWEELLLKDADQKIILGKNRKPIEILINYKKYDKNPDREEAVNEILTTVKKQERPNVTIDDLINRRFGRRVKIFEEIKQEWEEKKERQEWIAKEKENQAIPPEVADVAPATFRELETVLEEPLQEIPDEKPSETLAGGTGQKDMMKEFTGAKEGEELPAPSDLPQQQDTEKIVVGGDDVGYKM